MTDPVSNASFELLRKRLNDGAERLREKIEALNQARLQAFGRVESKLLARLALRTEHNALARDIVRIGPHLLFGYRVMLGLKRETEVADVFGLYRLADQADGIELVPESLEGSFLSDQRFLNDFRELFAYYKAAELDQLRVLPDKLLLIFRTGTQGGDKRVLRFARESDGRLTYLDNRGERDHVLPPRFDFEWQTAGRDAHVLGRHPHLNILDQVFVETINGDLTIKIENNTETGLGIWSEPVDDATQSLADAEIGFAELRELILLRIRPYRETRTRFFVFHKRLKTVQRLDELGESCAQLPEDHGLVFPGGFYLNDGSFKRYLDLGQDFSGHQIKRMIRSPNGEDVLYVFYRDSDGLYALTAYNLIDRQFTAPWIGTGYARFDDGRLVIALSDQSEPARLHTVQLWQTAFGEAEHHANKPKAAGLLGRLGNAALVRALAESKRVAQLCGEARDQAGFERLLAGAAKCVDAYPWLNEAEIGNVLDDISAASRNARAALDAYAELERVRGHTGKAIERQAVHVKEWVTRVESLLWQKPDDFVEAIAGLNRVRGQVSQLRDLPLADLAHIEPLEVSLQTQLQRVGERALRFFDEPKALEQLRSDLQSLASAITTATDSAALKAPHAKLDQLAESLDGLTQLLGGFEQADASLRARLLQNLGQLYAEVNRQRAAWRVRNEQLGEQEQGVEFGAQLSVLEQALGNALARLDTPEAVDAALSRCLSQIEALETRFGAQPAFAEELASRRESVLEAMSARREQLQQQRGKQSQALVAAIQRVLDGVPRRLQKLTSLEDVHAFFASDVLLERVRGQLSQLRELGSRVEADEWSARLQALKEAGLRDTRDRVELGSGEVLLLGGKRFTVEQRQLEPVLAREGEHWTLRLLGTDYRQAIALDAERAYESVWSMELSSESDAVYRAEYLVWTLWRQWQGMDATTRQELCTNTAALQTWVSEQAMQRAAEDHQRGVHDVDASKLLQPVLQRASQIGGLITPTEARVVIQLWYSQMTSAEQVAAQQRAKAWHWLLQQGGALECPEAWQTAWLELAKGLGLRNLERDTALHYLVHSLKGSSASFEVREAAAALADSAQREWPADVLQSRNALPLIEAVRLLRDAFLVLQPGADDLVLEAAVMVYANLQWHRLPIDTTITVDGISGEHPRVAQGQLRIELAEFSRRVGHHHAQIVPQFKAWQRLKQQQLDAAKTRLNLSQFEAKPMAGFVRNRLIDEAYLPLIAQNLAKQIGTVDDARSDRSGCLLLISPPGYGKTTLMEYLANRLGLIFVRINGPTIGHEVEDFDPHATNSKAAREELQKLNLGLAMGNNVMLYIDDIQHLSPTLLQKFISLSDATRRVDAVIEGEARTIDLRGKRFALVMAGNPYTESGQAFRLPDMLANRSDTYNLGDVLGGHTQAFADSYLENAFAFHPLTQGLHARGRAVIDDALKIARGLDAELPADYPQRDETRAVIERLGQIRDVLMRVNAAYVASAAQDDAHRIEPPFKLQGSYRNMGRLAPRVSALMSETELAALLEDHYRGEAQTLAARAEENLLKLKQLIGQPSETEQARWSEICEGYRRLQKQGGKDANGATRIAQLLAEMSIQLEKLSQVDGNRDVVTQLEHLRGDLRAASAAHTDKVLAASETPPALQFSPALEQHLQTMATAYHETLVPLVSAMHHKLRLDQSIWEHLQRVRTDLDELVNRLAERGKK